MKYIFYLLVLCLIFSFGMYVGIDRGGHTLPVQNKVIASEEPKEEATEKTDRAQIVEEVRVSTPSPTSAEPTFLQEIAFKGEATVKKSFDQLIQVTHAFVEGVF